MNRKGIVYLVGAGPGDPELITVKGLARLREADVVVHDRLIHPGLLRETKPGAQIIDVGKRPGAPHPMQRWINAILIYWANAGLSVCRLKGGDPLIFGRGAEEAEALTAEEIPFEIIPGVSSITAVPASAGISLTHRNHAHGFMVLTACRSSQDPADWKMAAEFVQSGGTLVIVMGLAHLDNIATALQQSGCKPSVSTAVISSGTLPNQESTLGTLSDMAGKASRLQSPVMIVVGDAVKATIRTELAGAGFIPAFNEK